VILLDTQAIAWMIAAPENLSKAAHDAISEARKGLGLAISDRSLLGVGHDGYAAPDGH
jgi:PIN domain nuclease of toxin-antitoxin system